MQGNKEIIQIIIGLTALIEHNPEETIKTAMIDSIKEKTKVLKDQDREEGQKVKQEPEETPGPQPGEEIKTEQRPEILRFGEYIKKMSFGNLSSKPMEQHYEDFAQS